MSVRSLLCATILLFASHVHATEHARAATPPVLKFKVARRLEAMGLTTFSHHVQLVGSPSAASRSWFVNDVVVRPRNQLPVTFKHEGSVDVTGTFNAQGDVDSVHYRALRD